MSSLCASGQSELVALIKNRMNYGYNNHAYCSACLLFYEETRNVVPKKQNKSKLQNRQQQKN